MKFIFRKNLYLLLLMPSCLFSSESYLWEENHNDIYIKIIKPQDGILKNTSITIEVKNNTNEWILQYHRSYFESLNILTLNEKNGINVDYQDEWGAHLSMIEPYHFRRNYDKLWPSGNSIDVSENTSIIRFKVDLWKVYQLEADKDYILKLEFKPSLISLAEGATSLGGGYGKGISLLFNEIRIPLKFSKEVLDDILSECALKSFSPSQDNEQVVDFDEIYVFSGNKSNSQKAYSYEYLKEGKVREELNQSPISNTKTVSKSITAPHSQPLEIPSTEETGESNSTLLYLLSGALVLGVIIFAIRRRGGRS